MGTRAHLIVDAPARHLIADAVAKLRDWNGRWTRFDDSSELSALNHAEGRPVVVSTDTAALIALAIDAWRVTDGAFDPTVHDTLVRAGYGRPFAAGPTEPGAAVDVPGPAAIECDPSTGLVHAPAHVRVDLGGIAKGHAADLLVRDLLERGATGAAVTIGGDTAVGGRCPFADAWPIVADLEPSEPVAHLERGGFCFSTTQRRRWVTAAGPAHHLIDPRTGRPADSGVTTAAIAASTAAAAEVFATACVVVGWPAARQLAEGAGLSGFVVTDLGERHDIGVLAQNPPESATRADGRRRE